MKYSLLTTALLVNFAANANSTKELEVIEVTADKVGNPVDERVSPLEGAQLIDAEYIRAQQASTLEEALRKTTSVQVDQQGGNQGSNVMIRGLSGDQITTRIDGIPKNFNQTRHGGSNNVWVDPDIIQKITVIPGVAANLYGSGSLGGFINMETRDPDDVIPADQQYGVKLRQGYESNGGTLISSAEFGSYLTNSTSALINYTYRDSGTYEDGNGNEAIGGSSGSIDNSLLTKLVHKNDNLGDFELTYLGLTKSYTSRGAISQGKALSSVTQSTDISDTSWSLEHDFDSQSYEWLNLNSKIGTATTERTRISEGESVSETWEVTTNFAEIQNQASFDIGSTSHQLNVGVDYTFDDITTAYFAQDGSQNQRERKIFGLYASDRISPSDNLNIVLGARYDDFELKDLTTGATSSNQGFFPKLHLDWQPFDGQIAQNISLFGVIGKSFRAPSVHEAFGRGTSTIECTEGRRGFSCTEYVVNEDLDAEQADSYELGLRLNPSTAFTSNDELYVHLIYIHNDLENYISQIELDSGTTILNGESFSVDRISYENIEEAEIKGVEFRINYANDHFFTALSAQKLEGENKETGQNLVDISPASANFSLGAYLFEQKSRVGVDFSWRGSREIDESSSFNRLSYSVVDLFGSLKINSHWQVQLRVNNVLDKLYTKRYQSLSVDPDTGEETDISYYEPGRNIKLMLEATF